MDSLRLLVMLCIFSILNNNIVAALTWPSSIDELEDIMFLISGYRARGFAETVTPCSAGAGAGRVAAAEFVRTAFHDMASGNVYTGIGGLDASIAYETTTLENVGQAFTTTLATYAPFLSTRSSMADIIALGVYTAVRSCGGPIVPIRTGRVDAKAAGPASQIPVPQNALSIFTNQFLRIGFNTTEMISVVACGHTLGGVHSANFPEIVPAGTATDDFARFDTGNAFDETVLTEYLDGSTANPLVVGPSTTNSRNSDGRVFAADNNVTVKAMADPVVFKSVCATVLQKMIDVVPKGVTLTDAITAYEVKPSNLQLTLLDGGTSISFTGEIRVRTTSRSVDSVKLVYKNRTGPSDCGDCSITTELKGTVSGFDDSFSFYGFSVQIPSNSSISAFNVVVAFASGDTETFENGGDGFPVQDSIILQIPQSCLDLNNNVTVVAAVHSTISDPQVNLNLTLKAAATGSVLPVLKAQLVPMTKGSTIGPYDLYSTSYTLDSTYAETTKFDVTIGIATDAFKSTGDLGDTCSALSPDPPTSSTSSSAVSSSTASPSITPSPTSSTISLVLSTSSTSSTSTNPISTSTSYAYEGCYTDSVASRTLTGAVYYDSNVTIDTCSNYCVKWIYFGIEYGGECYCGDTLASSSLNVSDSECSTPCPGNNAQICGAGDRLSIYENLLYIEVTNPTIEGYDYQGCFNDSVSERVLAGSSTESDELTVESCAGFCNGAAWFGVEYGRECYCDIELGNNAVKQPEADCSYICGGSNKEYCGAGNRINIYKKTS